MFDIWIGEVDSTTLFVIAAVLFVFPVQLLLCFKAKKLLVKLLPPIFLTVAAIIFFAMAFVAQDWDAIGYFILCTDPDDGITYKILLNDLRISRYAESGAVRVGENVQITYEGEIDESNTIDSAISASDVVISGGDVLIPE